MRNPMFRLIELRSTAEAAGSIFMSMALAILTDEQASVVRRRARPLRNELGAAAGQ